MLLRHRFGEASVAPTEIKSTGAINDALSMARRSREGAGSCPDYRVEGQALNRADPLGGSQFTRGCGDGCEADVSRGVARAGNGMAVGRFGIRPEWSGMRFSQWDA
jgi:hypothetical protein